MFKIFDCMCELSDFRQAVLVFVNYVVTVIVSSFFVWVMNYNQLTKMLLLGKINGEKSLKLKSFS